MLQTLDGSKQQNEIHNKEGTCLVAMDACDLSSANKMTRIQGEQDNNNFFHGLILAYHLWPSKY